MYKLLAEECFARNGCTLSAAHRNMLEIELSLYFTIQVYH